MCVDLISHTHSKQIPSPLLPETHDTIESYCSRLHLLLYFPTFTLGDRQQYLQKKEENNKSLVASGVHVDELSLGPWQYSGYSHICRYHSVW